VKDEKPFYVAVGTKIEKHRSEKGMTQTQLGSYLSPPLTRAAISNMEKGRQRILAHTLCHIADILGVELAELVPSRKSKAVAVDVKRTLERKFPKAAAEITKTIERSRGRAA
jgi:transcriptional regulator with XRE-family HTH domain